MYLRIPVRSRGRALLISICGLYEKQRRFLSNSYAAVTTITVWVHDPNWRWDHPKHTRSGEAITMQHQPEMSTEGRNINDALDLSESRAYDCALDILGVYKLTGNFPIDLRIVLKDLDVLDKITYEIEPKVPLSDRRHVVFRPSDNVHVANFSEITRSIKSRIGFDSTLPWWVRLFR
jgi:hypothetical protein